MLHEGRRGVELWASRVRLLIVVGASALTIIYGYLTIDALPYSDVFNNINSHDVFRFFAIILFLCWVWGNDFDIRMQEISFSHPSFEGRLRAVDYAMISSIIIAIGVVYYTIDSVREFSIFFTIFLVINVIGWRYFLNAVREAFSKSQEEFEKKSDLHGLVMLGYLREYFYGRWQVRRFIALFILVLLFDGDIWLGTFNDRLSAILHSRFPDISASALNLSMPAILFSLIIVVEETWIWSHRFKIKLLKSALDELTTRYSLKPLEKREAA